MTLWELNRLGHLITLGQAYALTKEEDFAAEFFEQVEGWYEQVTVGDQAVTERRYRITRDGTRQWAAAHAFYDELARLPARVRWSDA